MSTASRASHTHGAFDSTLLGSCQSGGREVGFGLHGLAVVASAEDGCRTSSAAMEVEHLEAQDEMMLANC